MSDKASLVPVVNRPDIFWKLLECSGDMDALCAQKWCGPCHVGRELGPYLFTSSGDGFENASAGKRGT
ncbi:hypothetical protein Hanom_Chr15g01339761 [Helianthus anomalus]